MTYRLDGVVLYSLDRLNGLSNKGMISRLPRGISAGVQRNGQYDFKILLRQSFRSERTSSNYWQRMGEDGC